MVVAEDIISITIINIAIIIYMFIPAKTLSPANMSIKNVYQNPISLLGLHVSLASPVDSSLRKPLEGPLSSHNYCLTHTVY